MGRQRKSTRTAKPSFTVRFFRDEDGFIVAHCKELPGCVSQGTSLPEARDNVREAMMLYLETLSHRATGPRRRAPRLRERRPLSTERLSLQPVIAESRMPTHREPSRRIARAGPRSKLDDIPGFAIFMAKLKRRVSPSQVLLFGSRARADHLQTSDIDLVIVADAFEGVPWRDRLHLVLSLWDGRPALEPLCYTEDEFHARSKQVSIVREAARTGVRLRL